MTTFTHLHLSDMSHSGEFLEFVESATRHSHEWQTVDRAALTKESTDGAIVTVHNSLDLLAEILARPSSGVIFFPHTNLVDRLSRDQWRSIVTSSSTRLDVVVGSTRSAAGFPTFSQGHVRIWVAPTYGFDTPPPRDDSGTEWDVAYFGRVDPDKCVHVVLDVADRAARELDRVVRVLVVGPESFYAGAYWDRYCEPRISDRVQCDRSGWVTTSRFLHLLQRCRAVVLPSTSIWETWCRTGWQAALLGVPVFGPDWDGIAEIVRSQGHTPWPVRFTGGGFRDHSSLLGSTRLSLDDFNGYEVDPSSLDELLTTLVSDPPPVSYPAGRDHLWARGTLENTLASIAGGEDSPFAPSAEFPSDLEHLTSCG